MPFARFMDLALYHPEVGYYRRDRARVGYAPGTDFFTASTSGPVFGELVAAACVTLLGPQRDPRAHTFVEIGAEPGGGVLAGVAHPFGAARTVRVGEPLHLSGSCVVFSNELFDAQPFTRTVLRHSRWCELGVRLAGETFVEVELPAPPPPAAAAAPLPPVAHDGYVFDQPLAAADLAATIAREPWTGLFVAFDYGKTLRELTEACPAGTARAYHRHTQSNDLLAQPGEQDLTCHICWDWIAEALTRHGFAPPQVDSQESFFIRQAADFIAATVSAEASRLSQRKLALMQLLHPAHLGQKFQVLHALRT
ncbi:MAG: SAM-dependent methyltransferase [Verrucomicrobia bacterium]|nr:SAM-dependent methyltransferase [Verrucomicrobiota bacterium]